MANSNIIVAAHEFDCAIQKILDLTRVQVVLVEVGEHLDLVVGEQRWGSGCYREEYQLLTGVFEVTVGEETLTDFTRQEDHAVLLLDEESVVLSYKTDFRGPRYTVYLGPKAHEALSRARLAREWAWPAYQERQEALERAWYEEGARAHRAGIAGAPYEGPCNEEWLRARRATLRRERALLKKYKEAACRGLLPSMFTGRGRVWSA